MLNCLGLRYLYKCITYNELAYIFSRSPTMFCKCVILPLINNYYLWIVVKRPRGRGIYDKGRYCIKNIYISTHSSLVFLFMIIIHDIGVEGACRTHHIGIYWELFIMNLMDQKFNWTYSYTYMIGLIKIFYENCICIIHVFLIIDSVHAQSLWCYNWACCVPSFVILTRLN